MKKKNTSIFNSPITGLILAILSNVLVVAVIVILNRYSSINSRYYFIGVLGSIFMILLVNIFFLVGYVKKRKSFRVLFVLFSFTLSILLSIGTWYVYRGSTSIDKIINDMAVEDLEYSLITLDDSLQLQFLSDEKIAIVKDKNSELETEVKESLSEYSNQLEYVEYDTYRSLLLAAQEDEYSLMVVPSDFRKLLENPEDEKIFENSESLQTFNRQQEEDFADVDVLKEPFTVLMLGNNEGLSDSIIVASFNPMTLTATMTSLARDSYVPIACYPYGMRDKLNHARGNSRQCIVDTIEDFLDIEIDFYFETDFYALVKMVDTMGGLELESPVSFKGSLPLEDDLGKYESVSVQKGKYLMNGKEAITFARERHHMPNGDFDRQLNQQYVIQTLAKKIFSTRNIETFMDLLDVAKDNMVMNIPVRSISSLMGYSLDQMALAPMDGLDAFRIVQTQVAGTTPVIGDMSVVMPYLEDIELSSRLINKNISTDVEPNNIKHFNFSYEEPYKLDLSNPDMAGASGGTLGGETLFTIPNFDGWTLDEIKNWGNQRNIRMVVEEVIGENHNTLITQNPSSGTVSSRPKEIYIKYIVDKELEPEVEMYKIVIPDFTGKDESDIQAWVQEMYLELGEDLITWQINEKSVGEENNMLIIEQDKVGKRTFEKGIKITFTMNVYESEAVDDSDPVAPDSESDSSIEDDASDEE